MGQKKTKELFEQYVEIVRRLRKECPWDREQTHQSIRHSLIEEAYEVVESIDENNLSELKAELGDLLLHVTLHAVMAEEERAFTIDEVLSHSIEKLIRRHPHVFGKTTVSNAHDVKRNWERLKMTEGRTSLLDGVPKELPALLRAYRLQEKASKVGFDWKEKSEVWAKVEEEIRELRTAEHEGTQADVEEELGDLLFALVNYARFLQANPELVLRKTNNKFIKRFQGIERALHNQGKNIEHVTLEEMDMLWNQYKRTEQK
jgi:MazG family protein